jgi:anti-anti-sigma factor
MGAVSVTITSQGHMTVVTPHGDLTAATFTQMEACLAPLLARQQPLLIIDLSQVTTCDATGLLLLDVAARVAADSAGVLRLAAPPGGVCRALRQAGTMHLIATYRTVTGGVADDMLDLLATPHPPAKTASLNRY